MIGNDLVDLQLAQKESNWKRPRFLQKIFTWEEQNFIAATTNKDTAVWLLWSRKESAYKLVARMKKCRFFAPKKLANTFGNPKIIHPSFRRSKVLKTLGGLPSNDEINFSSQNDGQVIFEQYTIVTKSIVTDTYIHTIAQLSDSWKPLTANAFLLNHNSYACQHQTTRQKLLADYAKRHNLPTAQLTIQKDKWKIPHLHYKNQQQSTMISIAHHGHYGGYVFCR